MYFIGDGASGTDSGTTPMIRFDGRINNGAVSTRPLIGFSNAGTDLVSVLASGRVGIGTITPSASLHISGSSNSALLKIDSPASSNILFVSGSGNVGIGTSTPAVTLDVVGSIRASSTFFGTTSQINNIQTNGADLSIKGTGGITYITMLKDSGSVGIRTTTPSASLHVSGSIIAAFDSTNYSTLLNDSSGNTTLKNNGGTSGNIIIDTSGGNGEVFLGNNTGIGTVKLIRAGSAFGGMTTVNSVFSLFGGSSRANHVTINSSGQTGFGTISPSTVVHIKGTTSGSGTTAFRVENSSLSASLTVSDFGYVTSGGPLVIGNTAFSPVNGSATIQVTYGNHVGQLDLRPNSLSNSFIYFSNPGSGGGLYLGTSKYFSTPYSVYASGSVIVGDYSSFTNNTAAPARFAVSGSNNQTLVNIESPGSSSIFNVSGSGVVTINGAIPVTRNATGYNVGRFTNSASFDNIRVAISSSGNPVASSVSGSVNVFYSAISSVAGSAISSSVNTGAIFTTGSWSVLTSATLGSGGDTITSHIQDQDRGRLYRATFIQTAGPDSGSVVIERLI